MDTATIDSTKTVGNATCTPYGAACILRGVVSKLALSGIYMSWCCILEWNRSENAI